MNQDQVTKLATDAATKVYNKLSTQMGVAKMGVHKHNGHDTTQIDYNDLTNQLTATAPLVITPGIAPVISITGAAFVPTGSIIMYGTYSSIPTGYLLCDGGSYSTTTYAALFAVIGTNFGNPGAGLFNVPYMSGRVPVGATSNAGLGGGSSGAAGTRPTGGATLGHYDVGQWFGEETHTLVTGEIPSHTHDVLQGTGPAGGGVLVSAFENRSGNTDSGVPSTATGGGGAHNNEQPVLGVAFLIKT